MGRAEVSVPTRVQFTHAVLQYLADEAGVRILHIKGPAVDPELLHRDHTDTALPRLSSDADILVDPGRVDQFLGLLLAGRFRQVASFKTGSPFGHAATIWCDELGYADVHRHFPGVQASPQQAFEVLWRDRQEVLLANRGVASPSVDAQRLLLLLHAARGGGKGAGDRRVAWDKAPAESRDRVRALAEQLDARVALAAAIGELDEHRDAPEFDLWDQFSRNPDHSRTDEWRARIRAARTPWEKFGLLWRLTLVNTDHLAMQLGRQPTRREVAVAWVDRVRRAVAERSQR